MKGRPLRADEGRPPVVGVAEVGVASMKGRPLRAGDVMASYSMSLYVRRLGEGLPAQGRRREITNTIVAKNVQELR